MLKKLNNIFVKLLLFICCLLDVSVYLFICILNNFFKRMANIMERIDKFWSTKTIKIRDYIIELKDKEE